VLQQKKYLHPSLSGCKYLCCINSWFRKSKP